MADNQPHILLAEDDAALGTILAFNLGAAGFNVARAGDGQEAWEMAQQASFDLVLTDYQMPKMTGIQLFHHLRALPAYADTPLLLMTALSRTLDLPTLCDGLNVLTVFPKPFSPAEVVMTVRNCLQPC
ncbi:MAG: response regulator [Planctomycetales bacterium]|nr:response regulator [Planctomycetales bacterium]